MMIDSIKILKNSIKIQLSRKNKIGSEVIYDCNLTKISDERIFCTAFQDFGQLNKFAKLDILIYTDDGILSGNVNLLEINNENEICTSFPYNCRFSQRRENRRFPLHVDCILNIGDNVYNVKTKNLSGKGLACITENELPDFDNGRLQLVLDTKTIETSCRKIYSKQFILGNQSHFLNGILFIDIADDESNLIIKNCTRISACHQK